MTTSAARGWAEALERVAQGCAPLDPAEPCLVGVSGGRDSVFLLHALHALRRGPLTVCHVQHGLRRAEAEEDAAFVQHLAATLGLPCLVHRGDARRLSLRHSCGIEEAGRRLRHQAFRLASRRSGVRTLLLAHHADDAAETMLFHLARGTGLHGLTALRPDARLHGRPPLRVVRPLLSITRREIDRWMQEAGLPWREDSSNAATGTTRNRIRLEVLPALARATGLDPVPAIARLAAILAAEDDHLAASAAPWTRRPALRVEEFRQLPEALQRRVLHGWIQHHTGHTPGFETIERCRAAAPPQARTAKVNLPGGHHLRRRQGWLLLEPPNSSQPLPRLKNQTKATPSG